MFSDKRRCSRDLLHNALNSPAALRKLSCGIFILGKTFKQVSYVQKLLRLAESRNRGVNPETFSSRRALRLPGGDYAAARLRRRAPHPAPCENRKTKPQKFRKQGRRIAGCGDEGCYIVGQLQIKCQNMIFTLDLWQQCAI
jgi:hypothetical protein